MATRLKPTRLNVDNIPEVGDGASYQNDNDFHWSEGGGDMSYEDFEWVTLTGNSLVIEKISNNVTPTGNFTVSAGTLRPGIEYVLRVNTGNTPYTMTLGTGVTNPNGYSTELAPNKVNQFKFIATSDSQLELEGVDTSDFVTLGTQQTITAKKTFNVEPELGTAKTTDATNNGTKFATEAQVYKKLDSLTILSYGNSTWNDFITAYNKNAVIYCRASSNSNPATGAQNRLAFMAYVNDGSNPTEVEFQYYRSRSSHGSDANQQDEVYVYKLTSAGTWTVTVRDTASKIATGTGLTKAYTTSGSTSTLTIANDGVLTVNGANGTVTVNDIKQSATAPTNPTAGTAWYDTTNGVLKVYNGTAWDNIATGGAISDTAYGSAWDGQTTTAPSQNAVYDKISTMDTAISGNTTNINTINNKIPSEASASNQLADKAYVGDSINSVTAYYITKNANGDQFATYAELAAATTFYSGGVVRVPTKNDYTIVLDDENHDHATTRYIYNNGWEYQYTINETPLTQAQLNALNSGITAAKVTTYDGYATSKQDKLVNQTNIKSINNNSLLGSGNINVGDVTGPSSSNDGYIAVFDGTTGKVIKDGNINSANIVTTYGSQSINGTKIFVDEPVLPSKTTAATNTGTAPATEAQVYLKADASDVNTKTFYLSDQSDLTNAQAAYDWYKAGKNPIIRISNRRTYDGYELTSGNLVYKYFDGVQRNASGGGKILGYLYTLTFNISSGSVTSVTETAGTQSGFLQKDNTTAFTPTGDYNPATKKYVDDNKTEYNAGEGIEIGTYNDYSAMQGPAPDGFHVPLNTERKAVKDIRTSLGGGSSDGTNFGIVLKLPFAGYRSYSSASALSQGTYGRYWSSSRYSTNDAYRLYFNSSNIDPQDYGTRSYGFSVRCFKNSPVVPTSSWTKLYGRSIESGGIFWSSTDGLISLSSDGTTWITIADKNLGATQVWNSGDTLSEANCGKYYQWGNNYGFPRTGTIANQSTTQVDASSYGPGNYYSSDTFIKYSGRWDSTDNGNLWGGQTGVVTLDNAITNTGVLSVNGQTGDVTIESGGIENDTTGTTSTVTGIWAGSEAEYTSLGTKSGTVLYFTF